ncbi:hypothetical protein LIER_36187 [Lithospermum erythrorhizon]|uniref:RNase H type-1 domain-containing protein n=1 Tax=Lithospermum erythrorhizon TaxID=34254 RepID=A0AAV3P410_LITER
MKPPSNYKDIHKLTRCLAALRRFISKSGERNLPFFKNLRKASTNKFYRDDECNKAFEDLKQYLGSPQLLSRLEEREELQLHLAVAEGTTSSVLVREADGVKKPIYCVSHVLHASEVNYPIIDKFAFALVVFARKLKPYFESHPIAVITDQPLKRILTSPALSGRMTTWVVELSEFDITYEHRTSIKAQVLADFVIECIARHLLRIDGPKEPKESVQTPKLVVYVDRARNSKGVGAGIMIQGPDQVKTKYTLRFSFEATNNKTEYEAMIAGLMLVKSSGVQRVMVRGDSKLVMDQINGEYGVKNEILVKYHEKVVTTVKGFEQTIFQHVPRAQNEKAHKLSQLATTYYDKLPKGVYIELRDHPSYEEKVLFSVLEEPED